MTKPLDPDKLEREAALLFSDAWHDALDLGHDLERGYHDTEPYSWVAQCMSCLRWLALDLGGDEGRRSYGLTDLVCSGPPKQPALRRPAADLAPRYESQVKPANAALPAKLNYATEEVST